MYINVRDIFLLRKTNKILKSFKSLRNGKFRDVFVDFQLRNKDENLISISLISKSMNILIIKETKKQFHNKRLEKQDRKIRLWLII